MEETKKKPEKVAGIWVYDHLPEGMRVATREDLTGPRGPKVGTWFLLHHFGEERYSSYQVKPGFRIEDWMAWIRAGQCYVKNE